MNKAEIKELVQLMKKRPAPKYIPKHKAQKERKKERKKKEKRKKILF